MTLTTISLTIGPKVPTAIYTSAQPVPEPVCIVDSMKERSDDAEVARRIVACWNACQGIPTERLRPGMLADVRGIAAARLEQMESDRKQALRWRDALAKFSKIMSDASDWPDTCAEREALDELVQHVRTMLP